MATITTTIVLTKCTQVGMASINLASLAPSRHRWISPGPVALHS
jgi:hypothetical protein